MRVKPSKTGIAIVALMFILVIGVTFILTNINSHSTSTIKVSPRAPRQTPVTPSVKETLQKEKEILQKKGTWIGGLPDLEEKKKSEKKEEIPIQIERPTLPPPPSPTKKVDKYEKYKKVLWIYLLTQEDRPDGGFVASTKNKEFGSNRNEDKGNKQLSFSSVVKEKQEKPYRLFVPYKAIVENSIVSTHSIHPVFVASLTSKEMKGWKVVGTAQPVFGSINRFYVNIKSVISPEGKKISASGYVTDMDGIEGVVTVVRHDEFPGMIARAVTSAGSAFFDALRKDSESTVYAGDNVVVVKNKNDQRLKEAAFAGASQGLEETKQMVAGESPRKPTLFLEKGTPVQVFFTN